jgi:predicted nucleotide-binding protein
MSTRDEEQKERKPTRPFPKHHLEEALTIAKAIQDKNAGKPWKPFYIADALKISITSTNFRDLTSSSFKYGLTIGTWNAEYISLSPLGNSLTKPIDAEVVSKDRQQAVLNIPLFKTVLEHYKGSKFPSTDTYFKNMLEKEFKVPSEFVDEFIDILVANGKFADILHDLTGGLFVDFAKIPTETDLEIQKPAEEIPKLPGEHEELQIAPPKPQAINQIFVAHGKNMAPLEQLKKILTEFKVPFRVAIDEAHKGRPISQKVAELMKNCTSAIIIFTADEESKDSEGNITYRPSDNVVYELGAASVLYGKNIAILKEEGVCLASDFSDLGYIPFEKDKIEAKAMDIIKELVGFGLLKVTTA